VKGGACLRSYPQLFIFADAVTRSSRVLAGSPPMPSTKTIAIGCSRIV